MPPNACRGGYHRPQIGTDLAGGRLPPLRRRDLGIAPYAGDALRVGPDALIWPCKLSQICRILRIG